MSTRALFVTGVLLSGCIQIPDQPAPQCYSNSDCNVATGEVCDEGVCYGDPPTGTFGVSISPSADNQGLTTVERKNEELPRDGLFTDLQLEAPVTLTGRVTAAVCAPPTSVANCPTGTLGATLTITRPSRFAGGDGVHQLATSKPGDATSLSLPVPRWREGDGPYTITVVPNDRAASAGSGLAPAELVPPLRVTAKPLDDTQLSLGLGSDVVAIVTGDLIDDEGISLTDYRVSALGRWAGDTADSEVSSVAYTLDGHFAIALSGGLVGPVTIIAKPAGMNVFAPTLELPGVDSQTSSTRELVAPAALGAAHMVTLTVEETTSSGQVQPVAGASVVLTATVSAGSASTSIGAGSGSGSGSGSAGSATVAVLTSQSTTTDSGVATLQFLDGGAYAAGYHLTIVPPPGSSSAVLEDDVYQPADGTRLLAPRVGLQGTVLDVGGAPISNVSVTVRPSLAFTWSLDSPSQLFLAQVPAATFVTPDTGDFLVFVDATIAGQAASYDLTFEPPSGSTVPSFTLTDVSIPGGTPGATTIMVGDAGVVKLPDAAALHGPITDLTGMPIAGSELRVFRIGASTDICSAPPPHAPVPCVVPAQLQAHATADANGIVRFTLPRQ